MGIASVGGRFIISTTAAIEFFSPAAIEYNVSCPDGIGPFPGWAW
jgi:hypothetical protein